MNLNNLDLVALQTSQMKRDPTTIALCNTLNHQFKMLSDDIKNVLIYARVDSLDEIILDELAIELSIDWYDITADIATKRKVIRTSLKIHKMRGTPQALEDVIKLYFGKVRVQEWFEYDGKPYMFKVDVQATNRGASPKDFILLEKLIDSYKNKRSWLEKINIYLTCNGIINYAATTTFGEEITVYPWSTKGISSKGTMKVAIGNDIGLENITLYPRKEAN